MGYKYLVNSVASKRTLTTRTWQWNQYSLIVSIVVNAYLHLIDSSPLKRNVMHKANHSLISCLEALIVLLHMEEFLDTNQLNSDSATSNKCSHFRIKQYESNFTHNTHNTLTPHIYNKRFFFLSYNKGRVRGRSSS